MFLERRSHTLEISNRVLIFHSKGPWSDHSVDMYKKDMAKMLNELKGNDWAFLGYFYGAALLSPEGEKNLRELVKLRVENGMRVCSILLKDAEYSVIVKSQFERVYQQEGLSYQFFDEEQKAITWLDSLGFRLERVKKH